MTLKLLTRSYSMCSHISDLGSILSCMTCSFSLWSDFSKKDFKYRRTAIQDWECRAEKKIMWWPSQQGLNVLQKYATSSSQIIEFSTCLSNCNVTFLCMLSTEDPTLKHLQNTNNTYMLYTQIISFTSWVHPHLFHECEPINLGRLLNQIHAHRFLLNHHSKNHERIYFAFHFYFSENFS